MTDEDNTGRTPPPPLREYAAEVTAQRLDRMLSHIDGVRKAEDTVPVHQMRVWSRRTRAALEIFRVCFAGRAFAELEREVKSAADALSEARDLDVMIENLRKRAERLPETQRAGIESFVKRLSEQRDARQDAVAKAVTDLESHNLVQRFHEIAEKATENKASRRQTAKRSACPASRRNGKRSHRG